MPKKPPTIGYKSAPRKAWAHPGRESCHKRGYGREWERLREIVLQRDNRLCQPCLRKSRVTPAAAVDHILAKAKGGSDDLGNLEAICRPCHLDKTMREQGKRRKRRIDITGWPIEED